MRATMMVPREVEVEYIRLELPVKYEEQDMPKDYPHRHGDMWDVLVAVDTGEIQDWPADVEPLNLYMKVTDGGTYTLYEVSGGPDADELVEIACITEDYVPHGIVPGEYGDYVDLRINAHGKITNWPSVDEIDLEEFGCIED